jgi:hypothetical protein
VDAMVTVSYILDRTTLVLSGSAPSPKSDYGAIFSPQRHIRGHTTAYSDNPQSMTSRPAATPRLNVSPLTRLPRRLEIAASLLGAMLYTDGTFVVQRDIPPIYFDPTRETPRHLSRHGVH